MNRKIAVAVEKFKDVEAAEWLLERRKHALLMALLDVGGDPTVTSDDKAEYHEVTEKIRLEYEEKRERV